MDKHIVLNMWICDDPFQNPLLNYVVLFLAQKKNMCGYGPLSIFPS